MTQVEEGCLLRIFVGQSDTWQGESLFEAIVLKARELHLAGATVFRGMLGYGASSRLHTTKLLQLSTDLPVVIEIIDERAKIDAFLPCLDTMLDVGTVTLEPVKILKYRHKTAGGGKA
jgi:PII-like signaling protein